MLEEWKGARSGDAVVTMVSNDSFDDNDHDHDHDGRKWKEEV